MPNGGEFPASAVAELARRLQRVEDKLDERIATVEMLRATEKLFEARELTAAAATEALERRVGKLESANTRLVFAVVTAFLGLLVTVIIQVLSQGGA